MHNYALYQFPSALLTCVVVPRARMVYGVVRRRGPGGSPGEINPWNLIRIMPA